QTELRGLCEPLEIPVTRPLIDLVIQAALQMAPDLEPEIAGLGGSKQHHAGNAVMRLLQHGGGGEGVGKRDDGRRPRSWRKAFADLVEDAPAGGDMLEHVRTEDDIERPGAFGQALPGEI